MTRFTARASATCWSGTSRRPPLRRTATRAPRGSPACCWWRRAPVLVDLPKSVLMEKSEACYPPSSGSGRPERIREWRDDEIERAADMILESRSAVLYVGGGVVHSEAWDALAALAELTQIPVTTTLMGLGAFPSRDPLSLGMLGMHGSYATNTAICECDLLIAVGARFDDRVTGRLNGFATKSKKIQIEVDPSEINKNVGVDAALVGDARETLRALIDELRRKIRQGRQAANEYRQE